MDELSTLTETERLLLMAAVVQGLGPNTDLSRVNTAKVVGQVMVWLGISEHVRDPLWEIRENEPAVDQVYRTLVRMTHQTDWNSPGRPPERPGKVLFEGGGNWGVPGDPAEPACDPEYNSCRLTAHGEQLARQLLEQYPQYRKDAM